MVATYRPKVEKWQKVWISKKYDFWGSAKAKNVNKKSEKAVKDLSSTAPHKKQGRKIREVPRFYRSHILS